MTKQRGMRATRAGALGVLVAVGLSACGAAETPAPTPSPVATGPNLSRPCELLTPALVSEVSALPFFRTIVANSVDRGAVTCAQAVGAGGMVGVVRAVVHLPQSSGPAELRFAALCRGEETSRLQSTTMQIIERVAPPPATSSDGAPAPQPPISTICRLPEGGYAALLADRVIEVGYEQSIGAFDDPLSLRFATALSAAAAP